LTACFGSDKSRENAGFSWPASLMEEKRRYQLILSLSLLAVNLGLFLPSMQGDFLWDDKYFISENPSLLGSHFLKSFLISPFGGFSGVDENSVKADQTRQFYRPLTSLSYWLDFRIWGLNSAGFHLTNILLQTINSLLLFFVLLNLRINLTSSFLSAVLFSVFPLHFENVAWISGRTDLLSFLFGALSLLFFIKFLERKKSFFLALSSIFYLCSLFSKENALFLPVIFILLLYKKEPKAKDALISVWPFGLVLLVWVILRGIALASGQFSYSGRSLFEFLSTIGFYTWEIIFPFDLSMTVDPYPVFKNMAYQIFGGVLVALAIISVLIILKKKLENAWPAWAFFSYFLLLLPSAAIIFSSSTLSLVAWRFLYFPSAIFISGLIYLALRKNKLKGVAFVILGLLVLFYSAEIYPKNVLFGKDEVNFWLGFKNIEREDIIVRFNIGIKTLPQDEKKALSIFDDILKQTNHPLYGMWKIRIYEELAMYYAFQKDFPKAECYFDKLLKIQKAPSLHSSFNYAYFLAFKGNIQEGEKIILEKLSLFPKNHYALTRAAKFYLIIKDYQKAEELYSQDYALFHNKQTQKLLEELRALQGKRQ
jgi:tetratricopeptide (TPR) repeat protein